MLSISGQDMDRRTMSTCNMTIMTPYGNSLILLQPKDMLVATFVDSKNFYYELDAECVVHQVITTKKFNKFNTKISPIKLIDLKDRKDIIVKDIYMKDMSISQVKIEQKTILWPSSNVSFFEGMLCVAY